MATTNLPGLITVPRIATLVTSTLVSLSSGTNYVYSAYAPQLGARLHITHTQLNLIALAGNVGVYGSGPIWGRIVDSRGPRILLAGAFVFLLAGYSGMRYYYDVGVSINGSLPGTISSISFCALVACSFMTGAGGNGGLSASVNTTAKSFPDRARSTTTALVISGFGLSAFFFSTVGHAMFGGNTSSFLLLLALGTSFPMILGFFFVRPIPLPSGETTHGIEHEIVADEFTTGTIHSHTPLLSSEYSDEDEPSPPLYDSAASDFIEHRSHSVELSPTRSASPGHRQHRSRSTRRSLSRAGSKMMEGLPNVFGRMLLASGNFWLLCTILSLLSGTGLMYINNVGSISQALFAKDNPSYDEKTASLWQATQVSIFSVANCLGRILIGITADFTKNKLRLPRSYCISIVSSFYVASQLIAIQVDDVRDLWKASVVWGLAYGGLFGLFPTITIEWFGMPHFSENWGYLSMSPMAGGNLLSLAFGLNLDAHAPADSENKALLFSRAIPPSSHQCLEGRECYVSSLYITLTACFIALILSIWAGWRDHQNILAKEGGRQERAEVVWDASDS